MSALVALAPGTVFAGDFRVVRKLAAGGMGALYVAEQLSTGRARALKLMHSGLVENPALRQKFAQEARIGARIASEHVVEVVAAGVDPETGAPWLAMELLEGEDLASAIAARGALPPGEVSAILEQLCHALGAAHAAGIVHRDLKPENVFLASSRRAGAAATVKVLDFGIARVVEEARPAASTGAMGSPYWMSPEQTERSASIGPPADVWALGLVTFTMLTGKSFWRAAQDESGSVPQFLRELVIEPIPRASERARELGVELSSDLDPWFERCLARDPGQRFANARAAYDALAPLLGLPAQVSAPSGTRGGNAIQITPAQAGSAGLAHARTVSVAEEEEMPKLPVEQGGGTAWIAIAIVIAASVGVGAFFALRSSSSAAPVTATDASAPPPRPLPACPSGMVAVPQGTATIGADEGDARPAHQLTLNGFCIDEAEVTVSAFEECVKGGRCAALATKVPLEGKEDSERAFWEGMCNAGKPERGNHPANCLSHDQAMTFCAFVHKRLPTEEEWEYAARGEDARPYPWGADPPTALRVNVCASECALKSSIFGHALTAMHPGNDNWEGTSPARSFSAGVSPFGAYDMAGNVAEWTSSRFCPYPGNNCSSDHRTVRGGSFADEEARAIRAFTRQKYAPGTRSPSIGFRCAK